MCRKRLSLAKKSNILKMNLQKIRINKLLIILIKCLGLPSENQKLSKFSLQECRIMLFDAR